MASLEERVRELRKGASVLSLTDDSTRRKALESMAEALLAARDEIEAANREDIARAEKDGISPSLMQRLKFTDDKIASAVKGLRELAALPDPVGRVRMLRFGGYLRREERNGRHEKKNDKIWRRILDFPHCFL